MEPPKPPDPPRPPDPAMPPTQRTDEYSASAPYAFESKTVFQIQLGVASTDTDEEAIVVDFLRNRCFRMNSTGAYIWRKIKAQTNFGEIVNALSAEYTLDRAIAEEVVGRFLAEVTRAEVVVPLTNGEQVYRSG